MMLLLDPVKTNHVVKSIVGPEIKKKILEITLSDLLWYCNK